VRTTKLQFQTTADGYIAGPNGEMDWMTLPWSDDMTAYADVIWKPVDTIVLGRKLAEGFIPAWESGPPGEDQASIDQMNNSQKVVFSKTLAESPWRNAVVVADDPVGELTRLKAGDGGDIMVAGGGSIARQLLAGGVVDEIHLFVNPVAVGSGMSVFPLVEGGLPLEVVEARRFDCGVTGVHYRPRRD
jgi:dihydrofolate reductase